MSEPMDSMRGHRLLQDCLERIEGGEPIAGVLESIQDAELRAVLAAQIRMAEALREAPLPALPPVEVAAIASHLERITPPRGGPWNGGNGTGLGASPGALGGAGGWGWGLMVAGLLAGAWLLSSLVGGPSAEPAADLAAVEQAGLDQAGLARRDALAERSSESRELEPIRDRDEPKAASEAAEPLPSGAAGAATAGRAPPGAASVGADPPAPPFAPSATPLPEATTVGERPGGGSRDESKKRAQPSATATNRPVASSTFSPTPSATATPVTPTPTLKPTATASPTEEPSKTPTREEPSPSPSATHEGDRDAILRVRVERREAEEPIEGAKVLVYAEKEIVAFDGKTDAEGEVAFLLKPDVEYRVLAEHEAFHARFWEDAEVWEEADVIHLDPGAEEDIRIRLNPLVPPGSPPVSIDSLESLLPRRR